MVTSPSLRPADLGAQGQEEERAIVAIGSPIRSRDLAGAREARETDPRATARKGDDSRGAGREGRHQRPAPLGPRARKVESNDCVAHGPRARARGPATGTVRRLVDALHRGCDDATQTNKSSFARAIASDGLSISFNLARGFVSGCARLWKDFRAVLRAHSSS